MKNKTLQVIFFFMPIVLIPLGAVLIGETQRIIQFALLGMLVTLIRVVFRFVTFEVPDEKGNSIYDVSDMD